MGELQKASAIQEGQEEILRIPGEEEVLQFLTVLHCQKQRQGWKIWGVRKRDGVATVEICLSSMYPITA